MNRQTLKAIWKANIPPMVWMCSPLWVGTVIIGLDGEVPEWTPVILVLAAVALLMAIAEFANTYTDRHEDKVYFPSNPLVTGEILAVTAKKAFIVQNIVAGAIIVALALVTLDYRPIIALLVCWFICLAYSMPPFRLKETPASPFILALGIMLQPLAAWLVVAQLNSFMIAFAVFLFTYTLGFGITQKFRKTTHALKAGVIKVEPDGSIYDIRTIGFTLKVKTAMVLEAFTTLGAFIMIPIFWHLDIFGASLSIALLTAPLLLTVLSILLRIIDPIGNGPKCALVMTMAWEFIGLILLAVALASLIHWGYAILVCIIIVMVSILLTKTIHPFQLKKAITSPWQEL